MYICVNIYHLPISQEECYDSLKSSVIAVFRAVDEQMLFTADEGKTQGSF